MKISYYDAQPNFGDALNVWLWPKLLPDFFDENDQTVFLGIGSIIGEKDYPKTVKKILFGAGFVPEYHQKPDVNGKDWDVYFVRGPRTAEMLGLSPDLALCDPAILLRTVLHGPRAPDVVSFMPHWQSLGRGNWEKACQIAGVNLIDPRRPVDDILAELMRSRLVIAEAMHGAIVADALRIPWVPVLPLNKVHRNKWLDWADSLEIKLRPHHVCPSSLTEARLSFMRQPIAASPLAGWFETGLTHGAARMLGHLRRVSPALSDDRVIDRATAQMLEKVEKLRRDYAASAAPATGRAVSV